MTTAIPTLTPAAYRTRRAELDEALAQKTADYEAAALHAASDPASRHTLAQMRHDLAELEQERQDLDAAWRAAQRAAGAAADHEDARRRREALSTADGHIERAVQLLGDIERTALQLGDLVDQICATEEALVRTLIPFADERTRGFLQQLTFFHPHELEPLFAAILRPHSMARPKSLGIPTRASRSAETTRKRVQTILAIAPEETTV